jgi:hypothetical protein
MHNAVLVREEILRMTGLRAATTAGLRPIHLGRRSGWLFGPLVTAAASVAVGAAIAFNPQLGFAAAVALLAAIGIAAPAGSWALCALIAAVTFRGLVTLGALPSIATFVDIPLAWGALVVALLKTVSVKNRGPSARAATHLRWLAGLAAAVAAAWAFHPSEVLRPVVYLALLGEPFALVGALLLDPPSPRLRRALTVAAMALVVVQIPLVLWQAGRFGLGDPLQGTLYGAGAGAHTMSAVVVVGVVWLLARRLSWRRLALAGLLLSIPFLADAKQVIFALPVAVVASRWQHGQLQFLLRAAVVTGAVAALIMVAPAGNTAVSYLRQTSSGHGGKAAAAEFLWTKLSGDPSSIAFGRGPAESVSRGAFMTTDLLLRPDSPLRILDLKPAQIAIDAQAAALATSGEGGSFNSGVSSALGVLGDLGAFGVLMYAGLLGSLLLALRRLRSPEATAATAGWAMFVVLGFVYDWWEQPPLSIFLAVLSGLALTRAAQSSDRGERLN